MHLYQLMSTSTSDSLCAATPPTAKRARVDAEQGAARRALYEAGELCDGHVTHCGQVYAVSRMNCAAASGFFRVAFTGGMREGLSASINLDPNIPSSCVQSLLRYAHSGDLVVPDGDEEELVSAADQLEFLSVLPILTPQLIATVTTENCLHRLTLGVRRSLPEVAVRAIEEVDDHFETVTATRSFRELPEAAVEAILRVQALTTPEVALYEALLDWHAHEPTRPFAPLFEHIALADLGLRYLLVHVNHAPCVLASERAKQRVQTALEMLALPASERPVPSSSPGVLKRARAQPLRLRFLGDREDSTCQLVVAPSWRGTSVMRRGFHSQAWCGAFAISVLSLQQRSQWQLRVFPTESLPHMDKKFFVGVAKATNDRNSETNDGCVGLELVNPCRGDRITFTADPRRQRLEYRFELGEGRSVDNDELWVSVQSEFEEASVPVGSSGTLAWPHAGLGWKPFVAMTAGTTSSVSRVDVIDPLDEDGGSPLEGSLEESDDDDDSDDSDDSDL